MDWKFFIYLLMLCKFISESECSMNVLNSTFTATGQNNGLEIYILLGDASDNISCLVYADDETEGIVIYNIEMMDQSLFETFFQTHGYFDIYLACFGSTDFFNRFEQVYVGEAISGLRVSDATILKLIQVPQPLVGYVTVDVSFSAGTDVNLTVVLMNTSDVPAEMIAVASDVNHQFNFGATLFVESGMYVVDINAVTPLSEMTIFAVIALQEAVSTDDFGFVPYTISGDILYVMAELPFTISVEVLSGDMPTITATVYEGDTITDVTGCCNIASLAVCDISYTFNTTGVYQIVPYISNYVSYLEEHFTVVSLYEVNSVLATVVEDLLLNSDQAAFDISIASVAKYPMGIVTCKALFGDETEDPVSFNITENLPSESQILNHEYVAGWYTASINCTNQLPYTIGSDVTTGQVFEFLMIVENPVENLVLVHNSPNASYHPWSKRIAVDITLSDPDTNLPLENLTCTFAYESVVAEVTGDVTATSTINHKIDFGKSGIADVEFLLTVNCSNRLQHQVLTQSFSAYYDCLRRSFFDSVYKVPESAQRARTNIAKTVEAILLLSGACSLSHASSWTTYDLNGAHEDITNYPTDSVELTKTFPPLTFDEGHYMIEFTVNLTQGDVDVSISDFFFLNFTHPDLRPAIYVNGIKNFIRKVWTGNIVQIELNTDHTFDPADPLSSVASVPWNKTMSCAFSLTWDEDTMQSIMSEEVDIGSADNCDDLIQWDGSNIFEVAVDDVIDQQWYIFTFTVTRAHRTTTIRQAVQPTRKQFPVASFQNVSNGFETSTDFYKLTMTDLQLNAIVSLSTLQEGSDVTYTWKLGLFDSSSSSYNTVVDTSGTVNGFKVYKEKFQSWNGLKYRLSCTVSITGLESVTIYRLFIMNHEPYNGNCSLDVGDTPAVSGQTEVCFHCYDWKDEERSIVRDPLNDYGGTLKYRPVQIYLTADGKVNNSIPSYKHTVLPNVDRCFKLVTPKDSDSNYTRVEIQIQDDYLTPYASVKFDDIEIVNTKIYTPEEVYTFFDSFIEELDGAIDMDYIAGVASTVILIASEINSIPIPEESPTVPIVGIDPQIGDLVDILPNGTAVDFDDVIDDLTLPEVDPLVQAIQEALKQWQFLREKRRTRLSPLESLLPVRRRIGAPDYRQMKVSEARHLSYEIENDMTNDMNNEKINARSAQALHTVTIRKLPNLTLQEIQQIAQSVLVLTSTEDNYLNKTIMSTLENVTRNVFEMFDSLNEHSAASDEVLETLVKLANTMADRIVPDKLQYMESDVSLSAQRKRGQDSESFASPAYLELKEKNASMTDSERDFYISRQLEQIKYAVDESADLANEHAKDVREFEMSLVKEATISNGAETEIGDNSSYAKLTTDLPKHLANKTITAPTTSVNFPNLDMKGDEPIKIGLFETETVMNIDKVGTAATIRSNEKRLILHSDGEIPKRVTFLHKISETETLLVDPAINDEDASGFDYLIVEVNRPDDDLKIYIQPNSEEIRGYDVYLLCTDEEDKHVSKLEYDAKAECRFPTYIADFPPTVRGTQTGVCRFGIEPIFKDEFDSENRKRSRRSPPLVILPDLNDEGDQEETVQPDESANDTLPKYPPYSLATATMGCKTWDENAETWRSDECKSTWRPEKAELECDCTAKREMTFANSFYVQPNAIDFSSVFLKFSPLNQAAVMATLALVFIIYVLIILWARRQDRHDLLRWGITPLCDNYSVDNYFYIIKVHTGLRPGAGTKSRVNMVIAGEELDTGIRELADGVRHEFSTGSVMTFLLSTSVYLGDLEYMRIWHDNSGGGENASWYLSKIDLHDIQRDEMFTFLVEQWLAVEEGCLECVAPVCKNENLNVFKNRFVTNMKENFADSHMWVSVAYRPNSSNFTRVQRASCALVFIMLTMIANAMFFKGSNDENYETPAELHVGPFQFSLQEIYISFISALIVTPATILLIYLFKLSRIKPKKTNEVLYKPREKCCFREIPVLDNWLEREQRRSMELEKQLVMKGYPELTGFTLPEDCIKLAWTVVVVATVLPAFFIMMYSMEWGKQKSEEWVTTFLLSFFQSVFCLDPIKVFFMAMTFALVFRTMATSANAFSRNAIIRNYTSEIRGKSSGVRMKAPPLDKKTLRKARFKRQLERKMKSIFCQSILLLFLIWILISISFISRDARSFAMYQRVVDTFIQPLDTPHFSSIKTTNDFFDWLNQTFLIKAFPEDELGGNNSQLYWKYRNFIDGGELFRVGPPRLRQLRTTEEQCLNPFFGKKACYRKYVTLTEDTQSYCIGWKDGPCNPKEKLNNFSADAWKFTSALDIWGAPVAGYYTTYGGGGYIAKLSVNRQVSQFIVEELYKNSWVDRQTRAVMIEFTLYCLNANIFTYSMLLVEFAETGGAFTFNTIAPLRVYSHLGSLGVYAMVCEFFFVLYLITQTAIVAVNIVRNKKEFFKSRWNVYDLIYIVLGYLAIILYIIQRVLVEKSLQVFREDKREFVNFYHIAIWNQVLVLNIGILVFMAIVRMIGVLGYNRRIGVIVRVFSKAATDLFWFGLFFLFFFTTYAIFGYLLFGWKLRSYMNVFKSMETLFVSMLGKSRFAEIEDTDPILSKFYFMIFIFFVVYMILTMFLGILSKAIDDAAAETRKSNEEEMVDYLIGKLLRLVKSYGNSKNTVSPSVENQTASKYIDRRKVADECPHDVLKEIREAITESLIADGKGFTTPDSSKVSKFRRQ